MSRERESGTHWTPTRVIVESYEGNRRQRNTMSDDKDTDRLEMLRTQVQGCAKQSGVWVWVDRQDCRVLCDALGRVVWIKRHPSWRKFCDAANDAAVREASGK